MTTAVFKMITKDNDNKNWCGSYYNIVDIYGTAYGLNERNFGEEDPRNLNEYHAAYNPDAMLVPVASKYVAEWDPAYEDGKFENRLVRSMEPISNGGSLIWSGQDDSTAAEEAEESVRESIPDIPAEEESTAGQDVSAETQETTLPDVSAEIQEAVLPEGSAETQETTLPEGSAETQETTFPEGSETTQEAAFEPQENQTPEESPASPESGSSEEPQATPESGSSEVSPASTESGISEES